MTELTNWRELSDGGRDLVLCLDFPGGRPAAGFAELVPGLRVDACFLHIGQASGGPLAACVEDWVAQIATTGRPVRAVLGFCAGTALATRVADAIAPPMVVLFDATISDGDAMVGGFMAEVQSSGEHLTEDEMAAATELESHVVATYDGDMRPIAAALADQYDRLMSAVTQRLALPEFYRGELTKGFNAYLDYRLLASEGGFDLRSSTPLFLYGSDYDAVPDVPTTTLDVPHVDLLRDPEVHKLATDLLTGERTW